MPKDQPENQAPETERTVFVNGLSYESTEQDVSEFFSEIGEIEKINLPKYQDSDRNIGYCHVTFETKDQAEKSMEMDGKYLNGRYLKLEWSKGV